MTEAAADSPEPTSIDIKAAHVFREWKYEAPLMGCRFDPTGRYVFAASMDTTIQRWDLQDDQHSAFTAHESWLRAIGFSPDGSQMISGGYDGHLCFWDATATPEEGKSVAPTRNIKAHQAWIRALAVHPAGALAATSGDDALIKLWSMESGELVRVLANPDQSAAESSESERPKAEQGSEDQAEDGDQGEKKRGHAKHVYSLLFHPDGQRLLSGDLAGVVCEWDVQSGQLIRNFDAKPLHTYHGGQKVDYGGVRTMALSHDNKLLACGGLHKATNPFAGVQEPLALVFDWESGKQLRTHEAKEIPRGIIWRLVFEADGTLTGGVGGGGGYVVFWGAEQLDIHQLKMPNTVLDMDRHPTAPELATAHHDGRIRLVRMTAKKS